MSREKGHKTLWQASGERVQNELHARLVASVVSDLNDQIAKGKLPYDTVVHVSACKGYQHKKIIVAVVHNEFCPEENFRVYEYFEIHNDIIACHSSPPDLADMEDFNEEELAAKCAHVKKV